MFPVETVLVLGAVASAAGSALIQASMTSTCPSRSRTG